jgi:hypothetical protein
MIENNGSKGSKGSWIVTAQILSCFVSVITNQVNTNTMACISIFIPL